MTEPAILVEPDECEVCNKPIPKGEINDCPQLGNCHPDCHTYENGCRGELCFWEESR